MPSTEQIAALLRSLIDKLLRFKKQKSEWKIVHRWVSFPTQINQFWDTDLQCFIYLIDRLSAQTDGAVTVAAHVRARVVHL